MKIENNNDFNDRIAEMKEQMRRERRKREMQINILGWISVACFILAFVSLVVFMIIGILKMIEL